MLTERAAEKGLIDWSLSSALHALLFAAFIATYLSTPSLPKKSIDIEVIETPKLAPKAIQVTEPKIKPKPKPQHEVFGLSRKSLMGIEGEIAKTGNTIAKTPDSIKLKPSDPDSLPIPSEDYLITKMPVLKDEVRIPYPSLPKKKGIQGAVVMDILIDGAGKVREVTLVDGPDPDLNSAAVNATKNFQFSPALIGDKPVAVRIRYAYRFVLEH